MPSVTIVAPGLQTTVQDRGRYGFAHLGIGPAGPADPWAAYWANRLVGNSPDAAVLEITGPGLALRVESPGLMALTGADLGATVDGVPWPPGQARLIPEGALVRWGQRRYGWRAYLAVRGDLMIPTVLGSRATDVQARIGGVGGRALVAGDRLQWGGRSHGNAVAAPVATGLVNHRLRLLPGIDLESLPEAVALALTTRPWRVGVDSNRAGLRLEGPRVPLPEDAGSLLSSGMPVGAIQWLPDGTPVVLLPERGTVGGYPVAAYVIRADWPRMAQLAPGDVVSFRWVGRDTAGRARTAQTAARRLPLRPAGTGTPEPGVVPVTAPIAGELVPWVREGDTVAAGAPLGGVAAGSYTAPLIAAAAGRLYWHGYGRIFVEAGQEVGEIVGDALATF